MSDHAAFGVQTVVPADLKQWVDDGDAVLIDVREPDEFGTGHIPGARLLPLGVIDTECVPDEFGLKTILYCRSGARSGMAAEELAAARGGEVMHLKGGLAAWADSGYPVTQGHGSSVSLMRQVHLVVGGGVLVSSVVAALVWPWLFVIAACLGGGLLVAGLTGRCGLAAVLKRMPWNRGRSKPAARGTTGRCGT